MEVHDEHTLLTAALSYARRGWLVIPLHTPTPNGCSSYSSTKTSCPHAGKHPRNYNGKDGATTNEDRIRKWWSRWPDANIGIVTGPESGLLVIDLDNKNGINGRDNLTALAAEFGGMPDTLTATTGTGEHLYFEHPGVANKNSAGKLAAGIDVRADGGHVVAAPSLHANGRRYEWVNPEQPLAELPFWLLARLTSTMKGINTMQIEKQRNPEDAPQVVQGERNDTLYRVACALRGQDGMERAEMLPIMLQYNEDNCNPPLSLFEVTSIVISACQHPAEISTKKSQKRIEQNPLFWWPFNIRDWFSDQDVMLMDDRQTGWHIRLLALAWHGGGFLPADMDKLWKFARAKSKRAFEKDCALVFARYDLIEVDGVALLKHAQMAAQYANTLQLWMKRKGAGEASHAARLATALDKAA